MWRSEKHMILDELQLPPQADLRTRLEFSPVEAHFYKKLFEKCHDTAVDILHRGGRALSHAKMKRLLRSLLKLRQACCHPQVGGGFGFRLQKNPMSMDALLEQLIVRAKVECEEVPSRSSFLQAAVVAVAGTKTMREIHVTHACRWRCLKAQRKYVVAGCGLAALAQIERDYDRSISLYQQMIATAEQNKPLFALDSFQRMHLLYNLAEALDVQASDTTTTTTTTSSSSSSSIERDPAGLRAEFEQVKLKEVQRYRTDVQAASDRLHEIRNEIARTMSSVDHVESWWIEALGVLESSSAGDAYLDKIVGDLGTCSSVIAQLERLAISRVTMARECSASREPSGCRIGSELGGRGLLSAGAATHERHVAAVRARRRAQACRRNACHGARQPRRDGRAAP